MTIGIDALSSYANGDTLQKGGPYIGIRGGKWADPDHKVPWDAKRHAGGKKQKEHKEHEEHSANDLNLFMENSHHPYAVRVYSGETRIDRIQLPSGKTYLLYSIPYYLLSRFNDLLERFSSVQP